MAKKARHTPGASSSPTRPDRGDAEHAVRTLIRRAGDDPDREGLLDTPARVVHKPGAAVVTSRMLGAFRSDGSTRREFLAMIGRTGTGPLSNT